MKELTLREDLVAAAEQLAEAGLNTGTSGNLSQRIRGGMLVTPSAVPYAELGPEDIVEMTLDGKVLDARHERRPSSEWRMHAAILRERPEFDVVVHTHSPFATTLACLRHDIPAFHYLVALAGGNSIRCSAYATYGSAALAENTLAALRDRSACLLANHGMTACGADLGRAIDLAVEVEALAAQYWRALQVGGPVILDDSEMSRVSGQLREYRQ